MNAFNAIAFTILMDHHRQGCEHAHPNYVTEKLIEFENFPETHAASLLDYKNQERLKSWCKMWNYKVPEELETWLG
jgi:hypothetical protein